jgi:hypothetical protein
MAKWLMENYLDVNAKAAGISLHRTNYYDTDHITAWRDFRDKDAWESLLYLADILITVGPIHYGYIMALLDRNGLDTPVVVIEALRKARPEQVPAIMEEHRKRIEKAMNKVRSKTDG